MINEEGREIGENLLEQKASQVDSSINAQTFSYAPVMKKSSGKGALKYMILGTALLVSASAAAYIMYGACVQKWVDSAVVAPISR